MYTRVGRFDFMIKPKITSQNFIPGIDQNNRTALLKRKTWKASPKKFKNLAKKQD